MFSLIFVIPGHQGHHNTLERFVVLNLGTERVFLPYLRERWCVCVECHTNGLKLFAEVNAIAK